MKEKIKFALVIAYAALLHALPLLIVSAFASALVSLTVTNVVLGFVAFVLCSYALMRLHVWNGRF